MELRVEELAQRAGVSVDTIRYYQGRGLLPPPARQGRVAHYGDEHLERLERIRSLQAQGLSLAAIGRLLSGALDRRDEPLVTAVAGAGTGRSGPALSLDELARRSGIPLGLLQAAEREGLLSPVGGGYSTADADAARAGLRLLELGLPLPELLDLARRHHEHVRSVAEEAVALFDNHVRRPLRAGPGSPDDAARHLVEAFSAILPATVALVAHHFERTLLAVPPSTSRRSVGPTSWPPSPRPPRPGARRDRSRPMSDELPQGDEKRKAVQAMFDTIAPRYDLVNR
ncbi:MAG: MerR family transcriptional regulator, partial [Acidimicrobiales bacterium]